MGLNDVHNYLIVQEHELVIIVELGLSIRTIIMIMLKVEQLIHETGHIIKCAIVLQSNQF